VKELICIVCPRGCRLKVDEENGFAVTGNACCRGEEYGRSEIRNPVRILTSTVAIKGAEHARCPVKLDAPISKGFVFEAMKTLEGVCLEAPVSEGYNAVKNVCGTGVNFVVTRAM
jgi:CxxC motif-containing protein